MMLSKPVLHEISVARVDGAFNKFFPRIAHGELSASDEDQFERTLGEDHEGEALPREFLIFTYVTFNFLFEGNGAICDFLASKIAH
jgi:hypothetical protein